MKTSILDTAVALSDQDLLARINALAGMERETTAELVAHLAALELRPSLYAARGYGSLFSYCTQALHLSEDAACNRINAARACRRFPVILDLLASGDLSLTSVRKLQPHITPENHEAVLARAKNGTRGDIDALVAELAPRPDISASVRRLSVPKAHGASIPPEHMTATLATPLTLLDTPPTQSSPSETNAEDDGGEGLAEARPAAPPPGPRPIIQASAPQRYRVQFTIGQQAHDKLRRVQELLRREVPTGDPGAIFECALDLLLEKVEKAKLGTVATPRQRTAEPQPTGPTYETRIRFETDTGRRATSRHIPSAIKRAVWHRDKGQCAFVSATGTRCVERAFLELHHIQPYALEGPATVGNIALRCRRHNAYEAELVFGPRGQSSVSESREAYESGAAAMADRQARRAGPERDHSRHARAQAPRACVGAFGRAAANR